jgi:hypothetical protein
MAGWRQAVEVAMTDVHRSGTTIHHCYCAHSIAPRKIGKQILEVFREIARMPAKADVASSEAKVFPNSRQESKFRLPIQVAAAVLSGFADRSGISRFGNDANPTNRENAAPNIVRKPVCDLP